MRNKLKSEEFIEFKTTPDTLRKIDQALNLLQKIIENTSDLTRHTISFIELTVNTYKERIREVETEVQEESKDEILDIFEELIVELIDDLARIEYLSKVRNNNVVLVGANGSGKSSFASFMKESRSDNIKVIPAQKYLYYNEGINKLHLTKRSDVDEIQNKNHIKEGRFEDITDRNLYKIDTFISNLNTVFSKLVTTLVNEDVEGMDQIFNQTDKVTDLEKERENTLLYKFNNLWSNLVPGIYFIKDNRKRTLIPVKNGKQYNLNSMSDGEKVMVYYICHVLLAKENSFIIVDEPETFLNPANFNRLWDALESYREDCRFIYISHVVDFIVSRTAADLLWCKSYNHPNKWEIKAISNNEESSFSNELLPELLGSKKPILFCEGDKSSIDYLLYSNIFREEFIVHPVGGHLEVINNTKAYNKSIFAQGNIAYGIIDNDLMSEERIEAYEHHNVYTLPVNEIEMVLLIPEVIEYHLKQNFEEADVERKLQQFTDEFIDKCKEMKEVIINEKAKKEFDREMSQYRASSPREVSSLIEEAKDWLDTNDLEERISIFSDKLDKSIKERSYMELLKLCPLKGAVTKGLANSILDADYLRKACIKIKNNSDLALAIKENYFRHVISNL